MIVFAWIMSFSRFGFLPLWVDYLLSVVCFYFLASGCLVGLWSVVVFLSRFFALDLYDPALLFFCFSIEMLVGYIATLCLYSSRLI